MTRLYDLTFEDDDPTDFDTSIFGEIVERVTTNAIKDTYSALFTITAPNIGSLVYSNLTAPTSLYVSFYVKVLAVPATFATLFRVRKSGVSEIARVMFDSTHIGLFDKNSVQIGSSYTYTPNTIYRIGFRYTKGTGADAILQLFVAQGNNAFTTAVAETATDTSVVEINQIFVGMRNIAVTSQFLIDNIRMDTVGMPFDDVIEAVFVPAITINTAVIAIAIVQESTVSIEGTSL